ncbi:MAG: hypothetical protein JNM66_04600 [Bryobacterales bacterium]|nr:hypothetical protein [Bryobacterales bacterium]
MCNKKRQRDKSHSAKRQQMSGPELNTLRSPRFLHLFLIGRDGPYEGLPYELTVNGKSLSLEDTVTPPNGEIYHFLPDDFDKVTLRVWFDPSGVPDEFRLNIGDLPPADTEKGAIERLRNMGSGWVEGALQPVHVEEFQELHGLERTGKITRDDAADLEKLYGC